ncbi:hypothetical protein Tco_0714357 [Tanacetum coccineum]
MESQSETTQTVSALKLPVLKTRDYDLWSMRMEQYLTHTDYALWEVIMNGDAPAIASASTEGPIPPKTAEQKLARKNELKAKSTLLLAILDEHLLKFHGIKDAKTLWEAIKPRVGANKESKKMQKTILKQQYKNFTASRLEGRIKHMNTKLRKMADEMLRQRCTSGDEHQYHIDQMKNFLKNPEAPALSLINQDLLYLKKGNSGPEKIVLSLHKFPVVIFNDDDIEERTSRWVNKYVKKFNPYARYGVEHWKNPHAKIFYIRKQKEPGKPKEEIYSNSKIVQVIKTYWELGHEHKFITEIVARRANKYLVSITEPDYKNLNKNDIEDIYLLIMNGKKVNLTAPTMTFPGIEDHEMFSIIYEPVHGIIYKNSKKEKRVMRHSEIHKFCDATLNRVLEGLKSYNNDVKYGYVQKDLTKDETEYLKLFEEEIEERLKHRRQMRRWEMYVNGRPLGSRRERPE